MFVLSIEGISVHPLFHYSLFTVHCSLFSFKRERVHRSPAAWLFPGWQKFPVYCSQFSVQCSLLTLQREHDSEPQEVGYIPAHSLSHASSDNLEAHVVLLSPLFGRGLVPKG